MLHVKHYPTYLDGRSSRATATLGTKNVGGEKKHVYWAFLQLIRGPIAKRGFWINLHILKEGVIPERWLAGGRGGDQSLKWQALSWPWRPAYYIRASEPRKRRRLKGQRGILGKGVKQRKQLLAQKKKTGRQRGRDVVSQPASYVAAESGRTSLKPSDYFNPSSIHLRSLRAYFFVASKSTPVPERLKLPSIRQRSSREITKRPNFQHQRDASVGVSSLCFFPLLDPHFCLLSPGEYASDSFSC